MSSGKSQIGPSVGNASKKAKTGHGVLAPVSTLMGHSLVQEFITQDYQASVQTVLDQALHGVPVPTLEDSQAKTGNAVPAPALSSTLEDLLHNEDVWQNTVVSAGMNSLPGVVLANVAEYLPKTSRAFFAAAMTASASSWQSCNWQRQLSASSRAIMTQNRELGNEKQCDVLDFMDVPKDCRGRLTDGEIGAVLVCMDAGNKLKLLKLTHCFAITGAGLEPLRGSSVLRQIDLSLVEKHESPVIKPQPAISATVVIPLLDGFIEGFSSLEHVQLPKKWRKKERKILNQFLDRYDRFLNGRGIICSSSTCQNTCQGTDEYPWVHKTECECLSHQNMAYECDYGVQDEYGMQSLTCYQCLKQFCSSCAEATEARFCQCCERNFCRDCVPVLSCQGGDCHEEGRNRKATCKVCGPEQQCNKCGQEICEDCSWPDSCTRCGEEYHRCLECSHDSRADDCCSGCLSSDE